MKNNFSGWTTVFGFTFRQSTKRAFKVTTALIAILIMGLIILMTVIAAKPETKEYDEQGSYLGQEIMAGISAIEKVFILDQSGLPPTDYKAIHSDFSGEFFKNIEFVAVENQTRAELFDYAKKESDRTIAVIISGIDGAFEMEALIPHNSSITAGDAEQLLGMMTSSFELNKMMQINLSEEELAAVFTPVITSYSEFGESSSMAAVLIKTILPMVLSFLLYFMLLFYSQTVSKSVSTEKTSKLMETLLTSVHPYAMITGKVLAITVMAVLQFIVWILSGVAGLYGGNAIAHEMYPGYENSVITFINFIKDNIGETGMTFSAVFLAVLVLGVGFIFYCVLAALAGCMVSKPEDVASTQGLFVLPIVISWIISYFAPLMSNYRLMAAIRYIPFTAPFCVPADLISGTIGLGEGLLYLLILIAFTFVVIILSAKIYKGLVLYTGQKANIKLMMNILKS